MAQKHNLSPEQDMAANPSENVWVQANAGTGKTSVLVQRLLRILFRSPRDTGILCLTYTNAAAGEMRNRILAMLRKWAMATDAELTEMLNGVTETTTVTPDDLSRARDIFFYYIDNPDVLKIKTIHGFCEEILHRFPIEASLSPSWTLISDANQKVLLQDAFDYMIKNKTHDERTVAAFAHIVSRVSEYYMDELLQDLTSHYKTFFQITNFDNYRNYFIDTTRNFLCLSNPKSTDIPVENLKKIIELAKSDQNSLKKPVKYLDKIINLTEQYIDKTIDFEKYATAYLTKELTPIDNIAKKEYLRTEQDRVYRITQQIANQKIFDDTIAMFDLSATFAKTYAKIKSDRNVLDFDDLILYTRRLFSKPDTMGWVLSQLDLSLNHILVDEAQDTSPAQWDILRMLAGDFFVDGDTEKRPHSLFVVGDTKQSIYGFQGADPNAFATSRSEIANQISANMRTIQEIPLTQSFRSTAAILNTVDRFFTSPQIVQLTKFANNAHKCFRTGAPGLVEISPIVSKQEHEIDTQKYIETIADKIQHLISDGQFNADDIMVLVQKRRPFAPMLVTELKRRNIPVAGSDRIVLPEFPAVRDLLNLARFCISPDDDYSLCCTLKSPVFRLTERDIFNLCIARTNVQKASDNDNKTCAFNALAEFNPGIYDHLTRMISNAATMGPYTFFTTTLNTDGIRDSIIAAMGHQAIDPIEEFLTICLAYERTTPGTMRDFLKYFITGASEIKRDMDAHTGVRVVTVHGSKGLESPVVFLIDTVTTPGNDKFLPIPDLPPHNMPTPWIWTPHSGVSERYMAAASAATNDNIAEYYRLLYVAMTRARDQLYITGYTPYKNPPANAWHTRLWDVLSSDTTNTTQPIRICNE